MQFLATGLLMLLALVAATRVLNSDAARDEALADAEATTEVLARSVAEPAVSRGLVAGDPGAVDRFDRLALDRLLVRDVRRIKLWTEDGTVVYSDHTHIIGERFELGEDELEILRDGGTDAELADLTRPENRFEPRGEGLVEVYTRIVAPGGEPLLFEAYYSVEGIEERQAEVIGPFQRITVGALVILVAVATGMLWVLTRRVTRASAERERLMRSAASASEAERRRIARDLHDGVVQELAGSAYAVSALARTAGEPQRATLVGVGSSLRDSLRSLRSLLVEIHPPGLSIETLPAALEDLSAPAAAAGVTVRVDVDLDDHVADRTVNLLWRVAQEAVRNTLRHARASTLDIDVRDHSGAVVLTVTDDGQGFDPDSVSDQAHYGLRGLESLARDNGGTLVVRSAPETGTTVRLEVPR
ncbi:sensor histidine kinase [Nocardioides sp. LHG3406-4]|uniref:sensor histidine kinase n=1 Tax=Nocardioides sp. LHG3406-4 TaxID=2804575 RepID=UPI003CEBE3B4